MGAQRRTSTAGREDVARELWASMFRRNWLLFSANVVLYLAQAIITLAFAYILKQTFDAVAAGSLDLLAQTGQVVALLMAAELATELAMRASLPAFLRRAVSGYRRAVFDRLLGKGIGAFDGGGASRYESALTNDVTTIETTYLEKIFTMVTEIVSLAGSVAMLLAQSVPLAVVAIVSALVPLAIGRAAGGRLASRQRVGSDAMGALWEWSTTSPAASLSSRVLAPRTLRASALRPLTARLRQTSASAAVRSWEYVRWP